MKKTLTLFWDSEDLDDRSALERVLRADEAFRKLSEIDDKLRNVIKYEDRDESTITLLQEIRDLIHEDGLMGLWE